jgi:hypothetical protein
MKSTKRNVVAAQTLQASQKLMLVSDAQNDQVRMRDIVRKKRFANLKAGMARLNDLLRKGKIFSDEEVNVRRVFVLREFHGLLQKSSC